MATEGSLCIVGSALYRSTESVKWKTEIITRPSYLLTVSSGVVYLVSLLNFRKLIRKQIGMDALQVRKVGRLFFFLSVPAIPFQSDAGLCTCRTKVLFWNRCGIKTGVRTGVRTVTVKSPTACSFHNQLQI